MEVSMRKKVVFNGITGIALCITVCFSSAQEKQSRSYNSSEPETASSVETTFLKSNDPGQRIKALSSLGYLLQEDSIQQEQTEKEIPVWAQRILENGLRDPHNGVVLSALEQIGALKAYELSDEVAALCSNTKISKSVRLRALKTLGKIGGKRNKALLADIINRKQIDAETREALCSVDNLCLVDLLPEVQEYTSFVQQTVEQIQKSAADASGDFVYENKPPISPVMMLGLAKGVAKNLSDGMCRNSFRR